MLPAPPRPLYQKIGLIAGPLLAFAIILLPAPPDMAPQAWTVVAIAALLAVWWSTEAIPVAATALIPLILFPLSGVLSGRAAFDPYAHPVIFLLLGAFIMAMGVQRWGLHKRLALSIVARFGDRPERLILGFMAATAFLSMWFSNSATTLMMVPIAMGVIGTVADRDDEDSRRFALCLLLGIAWSASIGGLGTIIGTPPNGIVVAQMADKQNYQIGFLQWMMLGVPVVLAMVPAAWFSLVKWHFRFDSGNTRGGGQVVRDELVAMGPITAPEIRVAAVFASAALGWMSLPILQKIPGLAALGNTGIALAGAVAMFLIPAGSKDDPHAPLLDWDYTSRLPWGVLILFGGGLSLAAAMQQTGLSDWLGHAMGEMSGPWLILNIALIVFLTIFLTELTSNTATVAAIVPVLTTMAAMIPTGGDTLAITLAAPAAMAGSCAFMLPVATAPNAIVFSTGRMSIPDMAGAGVRLNLLGAVLITLLCYLLVPIVFD